MKIEAQNEAQPFVENLFYERLIKMRQTSRRDFDNLSPASHLALGEYERQKRAAAMTAGEGQE
jgi:hypothetical protein